MPHTILKEISIPELSNWIVHQTGIDQRFTCRSIEHFDKFPHAVLYQYNSRGFRDHDWPDDSQLSGAVWCVGDSFTSGVGSPFEHTWPQVLQKRLGQRTINVSMDGASNEWIAESCCKIYSELQPGTVILMWSYPHRRQARGNFSAYKRRIAYSKFSIQQDYENLLHCRKQVQSHCANSNLIEFIIPNWQPVLTQTSWNTFRQPHWPESVLDLQPDQLDIINTVADLHIVDQDLLIQQLAAQQQVPVMQNLIQVPQLDYGRDHHHFDLVTANWVVDAILPRLK